MFGTWWDLYRQFCYKFTTWVWWSQNFGNLLAFGKGIAAAFLTHSGQCFWRGGYPLILLLDMFETLTCWKWWSCYLAVVIKLPRTANAHMQWFSGHFYGELGLASCTINLRPLFRTCAPSWYRVSSSTLNSHRAFSVASPMVWNSLPDFIWGPAVSTDCFRRIFKTYLFARY